MNTPPYATPATRSEVKTTAATNPVDHRTPSFMACKGCGKPVDFEVGVHVIDKLNSTDRWYCRWGCLEMWLEEGKR